MDNYWKLSISQTPWTIPTKWTIPPPAYVNDSSNTRGISFFFDMYRLLYYYSSIINISVQKLINSVKNLKQVRLAQKEIADLFFGSLWLVKDREQLDKVLQELNFHTQIKALIGFSLYIESLTNYREPNYRSATFCHFSLLLLKNLFSLISF